MASSEKFREASRFAITRRKAIQASFGEPGSPGPPAGCWGITVSNELVRDLDFDLHAFLAKEIELLNLESGLPLRLGLEIVPLAEMAQTVFVLEEA